jgi:hypothetical protein
MRSLIDIRGFFFDLHLQPKFEQLNFDLRLRTRELPARIRALANETHRRCPQLGLFRAARVPMLVAWYRGASRTPLLTQRFGIARGRTPEDQLITTQKKARRKP